MDELLEVYRSRRRLETWAEAGLDAAKYDLERRAADAASSVESPDASRDDNECAVFANAIAASDDSMYEEILNRTRQQIRDVSHHLYRELCNAEPRICADMTSGELHVMERVHAILNNDAFLGLWEGPPDHKETLKRIRERIDQARTESWRRRKDVATTSRRPILISSHARFETIVKVVRGKFIKHGLLDMLPFAMDAAKFYLANRFNDSEMATEMPYSVARDIVEKRSDKEPSCFDEQTNNLLYAYKELVVRAATREIDNKRAIVR